MENLKNELIEASMSLKSNRLIYSINFWFGCSESLKIGDVELNQNPKYSFFGWDNGVKLQDLISLEKEGVLKKVSEIIDDRDPLEKTIEFEIIKGFKAV